MRKRTSISAAQCVLSALYFQLREIVIKARNANKFIDLPNVPGVEFSFEWIDDQTAPAYHIARVFPKSWGKRDYFNVLLLQMGDSYNVYEIGCVFNGEIIFKFVSSAVDFLSRDTQVGISGVYVASKNEKIRLAFEEALKELKYNLYTGSV